MRTIGLASGVALSVALLPSRADACGGTFCDANLPMPVDQTGENILFVMDEGFVEAHIQIQYDPESEAMNFAWIVPVLAVPEFSVGSERLIDNLLGSTVPAYGFNTNFTCDDSGGYATSGYGSTSGGGSGTGTSSDTDGPGPEVILQDVVGAFEVSVLSGGTGAELFTWLEDNGYVQDEAAIPIIDEYLADGFLFAAFRLRNEADVAEIHPVTLRFENDEACVPLRLTRIAAVDDMEVRTFFLAQDRVVPETYRHVLVNPLLLDWPNSASNYAEVITRAVDADQADGHAFVTEYAGPSDVVSPLGLWSADWNATPFETIEPVDVVDELASQGLMSCTGDPSGTTGTGTGTGGDGTACAYQHTLLRGLLGSFLPVPAGIDEIDFYGCLSCYVDDIDQAAWDGPAFAAAMQERIIDPGEHATQLLQSFPTLTRMYTTISPLEMSVDPFFYGNPDLPDVDLRSQVATREIGCGADEIWTLPDGRVVYVPGGVWPDFPDEMPWEEDVEEMTPIGAPIGLVDNTERINEQLAIWNCMFDFPSVEECGGVVDTDGMTSSGTDATTMTGSAGTGGATDGGADGGEGGGGGGCGCRSGDEDLGGALFGGFVALIVARRRRAR
jgi:MYXO-CTERM domain-containing protein